MKDIIRELYSQGYKMMTHENNNSNENLIAFDNGKIVKALHIHKKKFIEPDYNNIKSDVLYYYALRINNKHQLGLSPIDINRVIFIAHFIHAQVYSDLLTKDKFKIIHNKIPSNELVSKINVNIANESDMLFSFKMHYFNSISYELLNDEEYILRKIVINPQQHYSLKLASYFIYNFNRKGKDFEEFMRSYLGLNNLIDKDLEIYKGVFFKGLLDFDMLMIELENQMLNDIKL